MAEPGGSGSEHARPQSYAGTAAAAAPSSRPQRPRTLHAFLSFPSASSLPLAAPAADDGSYAWRAAAHGASPLERSLDALGMGRYQWALLGLAGCGWAADNMWLQAVAIVLPRLQDEFGVGPASVGFASSATFAGMMLGALAWGAFSDAYGRRPAFNLTLALCTLFGFCATLAPSFFVLCCTLFLLGTAVGGSMPTDGTLFLENVPQRRRYLLTALSVFFAAGAVLASALAWAILPRFSCPREGVCGSGENRGWRYLLFCLSSLTALFMLLRLVLFRLYESPKYLVEAGRAEEAVVVLRRIAAYNGTTGMRLSLADVQSGPDTARQEGSGTYTALPREDAGTTAQPQVSQQAQSNATFLAVLPPSLSRALEPLAQRYGELLQPEWRRTTLLVWTTWTLFSLAFTSFNVYLSTTLEAKLGKGAEVYLDYTAYALAALPGALIGARLIETRLGRIGTMWSSTLVVAVALLAFAGVSSRAGILASSCLLSLSASVAYAALYAYAPEVFDTRQRATAVATASALSRLAGMLAPPLAGRLLAWRGRRAPLVAAHVVFVLCAACMAALRRETRDTGEGRAEDEEEEEGLLEEEQTRRQSSAES